jgi:putative ABC transport system permease protein
MYKDESNLFAQFGVDADTFLAAYEGELEIVAGDYERFAGNRTGCVIGQDLADRYGFEVGQTVPIIGRIFPRSDGTAWEFKVEAIYQSKTATVDQNTLYFHFDYLKESLESGATPGDVGVGVYLAGIRDGADPNQVIATIDTLFENGPQRVQTTKEADFSRQFISMLGNIPVLLTSIGSAVLVAIFFAVLNTMLTIGHERTRDIGIMKALGFGGGTLSLLLVYEALFVSLLGGLTALGFLELIESPLARVLTRSLPGFAISTETTLLGIGIAAGVGLLAGLAPGLRIRRLTPLQALRGEG